MCDKAQKMDWNGTWSPPDPLMSPALSNNHSLFGSPVRYEEKAGLKTCQVSGKPLKMSLTDSDKLHYDNCGSAVAIQLSKLIESPKTAACSALFAESPGCAYLNGVKPVASVNDHSPVC